MNENNLRNKWVRLDISRDKNEVLIPLKRFVRKNPHAMCVVITVHIKTQQLYYNSAFPAFPAFPVIVLVLTFGKTISIDAIFNRFF